jgi:hypothetical protein
MKKQGILFGIMIIGILVLLSGCTDSNSTSNGEYRYTESFQSEYQTKSNTTFQVTTINGNIKISSEQGSKIRVEGLKKSQFKKDIDNIDVEVKKENNSITLKVIHSTTTGRQLACDLDIIVPSDVSIQTIKSTNGNIEINSIPIIFEASTTNGAIKVEIKEFNYDLILSSTNGKIDVYINPTIQAVIDMRTTNGALIENEVPLTFNIYTNDNKVGTLQGGGPLLNISTVNGDIELHQQSD